MSTRENTGPVNVKTSAGESFSTFLHTFLFRKINSQFKLLKKSYILLFSYPRNHGLGFFSHPKSFLISCAVCTEVKACNSLPHTRLYIIQKFTTRKKLLHARFGETTIINNYSRLRRIVGTHAKTYENLRKSLRI